MSSPNTFKLINPQRFVGCSRSHTDLFTGDREHHRHTETDWQMLKGMKATAIALHDDRSLPVCLSPDNALVVPTGNRLSHPHRNALPHSRCEFRDKTFCNTTRMKRTRQDGRHTPPPTPGVKESFTATPRNGGLVSFHLLSTPHLF